MADKIDRVIEDTNLETVKEHLTRKLHSEFKKVPVGGFKVDSIEGDYTSDLNISWEEGPTQLQMSNLINSLRFPSFIGNVNYEKKENKKENNSIREKATDTAAKIRKRLKKEYPELPASHFSVKTEGTSWQSQVSVSCEDYPSLVELEAIVRPYKSKSFNGMDDSTEYHGYIDPETGALTFGADYVRAVVLQSDERKKAVRVYMDKFHPDIVYGSISGHRREYDFVYSKVNDAMDRNHKVRLEELTNDAEFTSIVKFETELDNNVPDSLENEKMNYKLECKEQIDRFLREGIHIRRINIPVTVLNLIGQVSDTGNKFVFNNHLDAHNYIHKKLSKRLNAELLEYLDENTGDKEQFNNEVQHILYSEFNTLALPSISSNLYLYLISMYQKEVKAKAKYLMDNNLLAKLQLKDYLGYLKYAEVSVRMDERILYDMLDLSDIHVRIESSITRFIDYRSNLFTQAKNPKNKLPNDLATSEIQSYFGKMNDETKVRLGKILNKNKREVIVKINENPLTINQTLLITKQVSKVDNTKTFYQTPFGMWVVFEKNGRNVIQPLYRLGVNTISESIIKAQQMTAKYDLHSSTMWLAEKMYMRK